MSHHQVTLIDFLWTSCVMKGWDFVCHTSSSVSVMIPMLCT